MIGIWGTSFGGATAELAMGDIPILIINSEADTLTPQFMGQEIYDSIHNEEIKMIWTVTDSEHTEMWLDYNQEYREKVQELRKEVQQMTVLLFLLYGKDACGVC